MEMPADVLINRFGRLYDNGDFNVNDYTAIALDIDQELQRKFVFIPYEEIAAVEIEDRGEGAIQKWQAGSGPEAVRAHYGDNPNWLYNSAVNALALWQHLSRLQEKAKRPEPGAYQGTGNGRNYFTVIVTIDQRVLVQQSDGGLKDYSDEWDSTNHKYWTLQRIDTTTGTITKEN